MGCFSFLCKNSGKPALSTSFDGSPCKLYLLQNGKVIEEMHGNYDSYGRVFGEGSDQELGDSFEWSIGWSNVCDLMFSENPGDGIAVILDKYADGTTPTTRSEPDANQGWGDGGELMGDCSTDKFPKVKNPYHKVY